MNIAAKNILTASPITVAQLDHRLPRYSFEDFLGSFVRVQFASRLACSGLDELKVLKMCGFVKFGSHLLLHQI